MIKRGDIVKHLDGTVGEAAADEAGGRVLVLVDGVIQKWSTYVLATPSAPQVNFPDTELDADDE
jgi:hypothetical protein